MSPPLNAPAPPPRTAVLPDRVEWVSSPPPLRQAPPPMPPARLPVSTQFVTVPPASKSTPPPALDSTELPATA